MTLLALQPYSDAVAQSVPVAPGEMKFSEVQFNEHLLYQALGSRIDISHFNKGNFAPPGIYFTEVYVNGMPQGKAEVMLRQIGADSRNVQPCMGHELLDRIGIDLDRLAPPAIERLNGQSAACVTLPELIEDASATFDNGEQRLDVNVPQVALRRSARGYVDPKFWDDGVPAMVTQYNANLYRSQSHGFASTAQEYLGLNLGLNAGPWRLRHVGSYTHGDSTSSQYQSVQTYLQRSLPSAKSQLTLGDAFTDGALFDSVGFRGVRVASDDRMYPESQRGYAPTVRGFANSNARVQVRQNGNILYETTVSAGAFEINDLYPTGYGGDLEVVITEANGQVRTFKVPYAAAVNALRPGITRYSVTGGQYRQPNVRITPFLVQGTLQHGFTNLFTGYGGTTLSQGYTSGLAGVALNTDLGAVGLDITHASTQLSGLPSRSGQSLRLAYSKFFDPTDTSITLAAYRYSTGGFLRLVDAMTLRDLLKRNQPTGDISIARQQFQVTVNQALAPGYGNFYVSGSSTNYWNRSGRDTQFQTGYNNNFGRVSYNLSAARLYNLGTSEWDNRVMLTLSFPLGSAAHALYASTSLQHDSRGANTLQQTVSGALGDTNAVTYGLNASHSSGQGTRTTSAGANAAYASPYTTLSGSLSQGNHYSQQSAGASGTLVAYGGGLAFSPSTGDTLAVVEAPDARGASVANTSGLRVDPWGHAVVTSLVPFARNPVNLDPQGLPLSVELKSTEQQAVPTAGAVVRVKFETRNSGQAAVIQGKTAAGAPLPFGAQVLDANGTHVGIVGQGGRFIARGLQDRAARLNVSWGTAANQRCQLDYQLPPENASKPFAISQGTCQ